MKIPTPIAEAVQPLFDTLPPEQAMTQLVVTQGPTQELHALVEAVLRAPALAGCEPLAAALWLYVDDLARSHKVSQGIETPTGSYWHGIMHRREGDFGNSHYWFHRVGAHPAMAVMTNYNAHRFIDDVEAKHEDGPEELVERQRREWVALFEWCANNP
ncbi:MAG: hypothetical protein HZB26_06930 [Candidatus Hydrogenedentes bacterium]|nr:hypothetical protein [Candidatus Hydrogenedentota bacterium]